MDRTGAFESVVMMTMFLSSHILSSTDMEIVSRGNDSSTCTLSVKHVQ